MLNIISLGAGVQSSTMALMAAKGEITPMPDAAIFADTQSEPQAVYDWLQFLIIELPFDVVVVTAGNLGLRIGAKRPTGAFRIVPIPAFVKNPNGNMGGLLNRSCTRDYKIDPIRKRVREILGIHKKISPVKPVCSQWIGISRDECHRAKPSREQWQVNRFPLLEIGMTRSDCLAWMKTNGYPAPPKSSCVFCPFHSDAQWRGLGKTERETANEVDDSLRSHPAGEYRSRGTLFLHRSGLPLREIDFDNQPSFDFEDDDFDLECEGMCGV